MSQTLSIKLSGEAYGALRRAAEAVGTSPARLAATSLEQQFGAQPSHPPSTEAEKQDARERFERHFGEVDLGYATGVDNEGIDADLASAYADDAEED